jgi:hypothetical protein
MEELNNELRYFPAFSPSNMAKMLSVHGFDPLKHTKKEFLEFCERLKAAEDIFKCNFWRKAQSESKRSLQGQGREKYPCQQVFWLCQESKEQQSNENLQATWSATIS